VSESLQQNIGSAINYLNDKVVLIDAEDASLQSQINSINTFQFGTELYIPSGLAFTNTPPNTILLTFTKTFAANDFVIFKAPLTLPVGMPDKVTGTVPADAVRYQPTLIVTAGASFTQFKLLKNSSIIVTSSVAQPTPIISMDYEFTDKPGAGTHTYQLAIGTPGAGSTTIAGAAYFQWVRG